MLLPRTGAAVATAALLAVSACGAAGPDGADPRPATAGGSWSQGGTSGTGTFRPLPVETGWGPSKAEIDRARRLVGGLSLRERAGQVIVASYGGTAAPTDLVRRLHLGGVVAFSENIAGTAQIASSNRALQRSAARDGRRWPVLVGVDQEGGLVARVTSGATGFPAFMTTGAAGDPAADPRGLRRQRWRAARARVHRRLRAGLRRHGRTVRPGDRRALGRLLARAGRHPGHRRGPGVRVGRPGAGRQALPGPRLGDHRQPLRAARAAPVAGRAARAGPGAVPGRRRRGHVLGDGRPPRRTRRRPADAVVAVARRGDRAAARRARLPGGGVHRLPADGGGRGAVRQRRFGGARPAGR